MKSDLVLRRLEAAYGRLLEASDYLDKAFEALEEKQVSPAGDRIAGLQERVDKLAHSIENERDKYFYESRRM